MKRMSRAARNFATIERKVGISRRKFFLIRSCSFVYTLCCFAERIIAATIEPIFSGKDVCAILGFSFRTHFCEL